MSFLFFFEGSQARAQAAGDSLKIKLPKHFFNTVIVLDRYQKPEVDLPDTSKYISKRLQTFGIAQTYISFYSPLATTYRTTSDSVIKSSHFLITANYLSLQPKFEGIPTHRLTKLGVGLRYIYNTGKKGVWFVDVSPFITRDVSFQSKPYLRMASTIVYSHNESDKFNWRLGITKSFQWGNRFYLPFIGLRFGRLDKLNLSMQFPRSISLTYPVTSNFILSAYTRPQGGLYNFSNADSLYFGKTDLTFHLTRYELNSGLRADVRIGSHLALYVAAGLSSRNRITFYSDKANGKRRVGNYDTYFYRVSLPSTLYIHFGFVLKFGKTRSYYNNINMYDAADLNNTIGAPNGNIQIPLPAKSASLLNLESVKDLVDYNDF